MIGTCRGKDDELIVENLKKLAKELGITNKVEFAINQSHQRLFELFQEAKVAIHTMKDEHFGIAVVELMSSGIITVAHNSAGPKCDIIGKSKTPVGYLADKQEDYAFFVERALTKFDEEKPLRTNARQWVREQFGIEAFNNKFVD
mmetsp:Transcript_22444/g.34718  ORF Transcript_22444/g.34718 Transcript_22444/m.34718 type:complete len:145 (+) Transcript_22444:1025-1459(+)